MNLLPFVSHHRFSLEQVEPLFQILQLLFGMLPLLALISYFVFDYLVCLLQSFDLVALPLVFILERPSLLQFDLQLSDSLFIKLFSALFVF